MTFQEAQEETARLIKVWGYSNVDTPPDLAGLVNRAYQDFIWQTDSEENLDSTLVTSVGVAEYTLPAPAWKEVKDVWVNNVKLKRGNLESLRRTNPDWGVAPNGTPTHFIHSKTSTLRLFPAPSVGSQSIKVWGVRGVAALSSLTTEIPLPDVYHAAIPLKAAHFHCRNYANGDGLVVLKERAEEYAQYVQSLAGINAMNRGSDGREQV
jgi:hypothetical protein